ncbi:MAG: hypothetical protein AAF658_06850, partial [Myxococcota bacterium]
MSLLLPVAVGDGEALWPWQLTFDPSFVVASTVTLAVAGLTFLLSRRSRLIDGVPWSPLALLLAALVISTFAQPDLFSAAGGSRVYNLAPLALAVGLIAGADASASGFHRPRPHWARLAAGLGLLALVVFLASPTAFGTVVAEMSNQLRFALEPGLTMGERVAATLTEALVVGLIAACVFVATGVFQRRPHGFERVAILLAAFGVLVLADSARTSLDAGAYGFMFATRAVTTWLSMAALAVAATVASLHQVERGETRFGVRRAPVRAAAGIVALAAIAFVLLPERSRPAPWSLNAAPNWSVALYEDAVPTLAFARDSKQRQAAERIVLALAESEPKLRQAFSRLMPLLEDPGYHRKAISKVVREINAVARDRELPFFLDADVTLLGAGESAFWRLDMQAYRIHASRRARMASLDLPMLWVESTRPSANRTQGFSEPDATYGVVILDEVHALAPTKR